MVPPPASSATTSKWSKKLPWPAKTELVGLALQLQPLHDATLYPQYTIGLHAWFLDQVRQLDPALSAYLHDGQSEKPFTLSGLQHLDISPSGVPTLNSRQIYTWTITALSQPVAQWLTQWLQHPPTALTLRNAPLRIIDWGLTELSGSGAMHPPTTYKTLLNQPISPSPGIALSFLSPTSFRRNKEHFPLPVPTNLFHSYLRRWNDFSDIPYDQDDFLSWIDKSVLIRQHHLQSIKTVAGKRGSVTGFTGAIRLELAKPALNQPDYVQLFTALGRLAPYCGTGHKTPFGLGQTRLGWTDAPTTAPPPSAEALLAQRIEALTAQFKGQRKRMGGDRATHAAETWATILARRETGESLQTIATDLEMPYETVKTYAKLARRALKSD
ncbi:MAG: CRISPR-associated endoribonuclease Cas6 [Cyanothece sp. SIO2G6]|nr:CRISPR-associated endoribonuclease Cas6 [Cyanothece sp. SIO2G6]